MGKSSPEIVAYITNDKNRVITGNPLTLVIQAEDERKSCVTDIAKALRGDVLQLKNGDYLIIV
jgi:hypothetical protein